MNGNAHPWKAARRVAVLLCLSASTACTLGPDYERPEVAVPPEYRFDEPALASSGLVNGPAWWQSFGDQHLDGLIREAVENNRDLRIATARVDEFSYVLMGTRSQAFPQAGYGASASRDRRPEQGPLADRTDAVSNSFSTVITASWEIDLWGRIRRETEAARANLLASEEGRRGVVLTLVSSVILGYITLLDLDSQLRIAEATLEGRAEYVRLFRRRLEGGYISGFEMSLVEADYETAAASIPELRRIIAQQEDGLSVLLGRNPGPIARASSLDSLVAPAVPASLPAELLTRRPDILQAEQQLVASNALIGAARALYFPRISITGLAGLASAALGNLFTGSARTWSFVGDISGPLFTGGGLAATVGQAEARREQALNAYELTIQNAFRDVDDSLIAVQMSGEVVAAFERRVASLTEALRLAFERYDNGYSDALDVLDTERNLFSAQLALADARGDRFRALVNLYRALGGDWVDEVAPLSPDQAQEGAGGQQP